MEAGSSSGSPTARNPGGQTILVTFSRVRATRVGGAPRVLLANGASSITCDLKKLNTSTAKSRDAAGARVN